MFDVTPTTGDVTGQVVTNATTTERTGYTNKTTGLRFLVSFTEASATPPTPQPNAMLTARNIVLENATGTISPNT